MAIVPMRVPGCLKSCRSAQTGVSHNKKQAVAPGGYTMAVPFDQLDGQIWMNGEFLPWKDAKIHVLTHGLHYASAVFEGERAYGGRVFKLTEHNQRLHDSAEIMGFKVPYSVAELDAATIELLKRQGFSEAYVRPIAWRGSEMMGVSAQANRINVAIAIWQWGSYFNPAEKLKGIKLDLAAYRRPDPMTAPSRAKAAGLYMICTISKHAAEDKGYADAMMLDYRGRVAEATGANVFFVKDGSLHTPDPDCFLNGITRQTVIDLAKRRGIEVIERAIMPEEMSEFSECFLTGSAAEVTPVSEIGGKWTFTPGKISETLMNDYMKEVYPAAAQAAE
jgi:branched-chain amino acid aminotransferase